MTEQWRPCDICTDPMDCGSWMYCHNPGKKPNTLEIFENALLAIALMDVYTREGEELPHDTMRAIANKALEDAKQIERR
jgi:hypothetical protein